MATPLNSKCRKSICFISVLFLFAGAAITAFVLMSKHSAEAKSKEMGSGGGGPETTTEDPKRDDDGSGFWGALRQEPNPNVQYEVLEMVTHDMTSFTQGLSYGADGTLYETTGLNGQSKIRRIDPTTFTIQLSRDIPSKYFGEGSTFHKDKNGDDKIIHITWKSQTGFIYDADTLEKERDFSYTTTPKGHEGWGITYDSDNEEFIVSDGSQYLYFWDRDTLSEKRHVTVTRLNGSEQKDLNELEFVDGLVCCNIWYSDEIICVDPVTGNSVKEIDFSDIWSKTERAAAGADVLNGIAYGGDHLLITGKRWNRMYKVKLQEPMPSA